MKDSSSDILELFPLKPVPSVSDAVLDKRKVDESEAYQVSSFIDRKQWTEITWRELEGYPGDPSAIPTYLKPVGFCYYIPAFMKCVLEEREDTDVLPEEMLRLFSPKYYSSWGQENRWNLISDIFNEKQKLFIIWFLENIGDMWSGELKIDAEKIISELIGSGWPDGTN